MSDELNPDQQDRREEKTAWQQALAAGTTTAYNAYLLQFPEGQYCEEALQAIRNLEEETAWAGAIKSDRLSDFHQYLLAYPQGKYAEQARKRVSGQPLPEGIKKQVQKQQPPAKASKAKRPVPDTMTSAASPERRRVIPWKWVGLGLAAVLVVVLTIKLLPEGQGGGNISGDAVLSQILGKMQHVEKGTFTMGCQAQGMKKCPEAFLPAHWVTVPRFLIGTTEVTQAQWREIMGANPSQFGSCDECPVENVSWKDVQRFIEKLNKLSGRNFRLPTEAEWEFAARGGERSQNHPLVGGNNVQRLAWFSGNAGSTTHPVGEKIPNEKGLYDMTGNVWEWTADCMHHNYEGAPADGSAWTSGDCSQRMVRGGGWRDDAALYGAAGRSAAPANTRAPDIGFRLAMDLD